MPHCGLPSVDGRDLQEVCPSDEEDQGTSKDTEKPKKIFKLPILQKKSNTTPMKRNLHKTPKVLSVGVPVILDGLGPPDKRLVP